MRLAELSEQTGVSSATLKYYLREGLLHAGSPQSRTQASYDDSHVARVRLVRALVDSGGLSLARAKVVIESLEHPPDTLHELLGVAQHALAPTEAVPARPEWIGVAEEFVRARGWHIVPGDPLISALGAQLGALVDSGVVTGDGSALERWADAAESIAAADLGTLPDDPGEALRQVVTGTVLSDPVLLTLRRMAQQHESSRRYGSA